MYTIRRHLDYNAWAKGRIADLLDAQDESILYAEVKSSFPSIEKTLLHIWGAEGVWLKRMQGESPTRFFTLDFAGDKAELLAGFRQSSIDLQHFIEERSPDFLRETIHFKTIKGDPYTSPVEEILFHVVNHGSFHRGQIVTMLRELGVGSLPSTDLITYLRI